MRVIDLVADCTDYKGFPSISVGKESIDCSLPGSPVPGILQARVLEWGAIAFSRYFFYHQTNPWVFTNALGNLDSRVILALFFFQNTVPLFSFTKKSGNIFQ